MACCGELVVFPKKYFSGGDMRLVNYDKLVTHINSTIRAQCGLNPRQTFAEGHARFHLPTLLYQYPELYKKECWDFLHQSGYFVCPGPPNYVDIKFDQKRIKRCRHGKSGKDWKQIFGNQGKTIVLLETTT